MFQLTNIPTNVQLKLIVIQLNNNNGFHVYRRRSLWVRQGRLPYASRTAYKKGSVANTTPVSYTHLDVYKRQV